MEFPRLEIGADGAFIFRSLADVHAFALRELPEILADDSPDVREQLFPNSYRDDAQREAEWDRYSRPDLIALFESRGGIVRSDLESLCPEPVWRGYRLEIPAAHRSAWMAALNAARLILAIRGGVDEDDMEREIDFDLLDEKSLLLFRIHILGQILSLLIEGEHVASDGFDSPSGEDDGGEESGDEDASA